VEENGDQLTSVGINLVCEVLDAGTTTKAKNGVAIAAWNKCTTEARSVASLLEFFALCTLRLAGL